MAKNTPARHLPTRGLLRLPIHAALWIPTALLVTFMGAQVALAAPSGWLALDGNIRNALSGANFDWANSGTGPPTYVCPAGAVNLPGPGGLFNCGRLAAGSAPPIAPTLTPAAASDPSIISAAFIVDPISTDTTACGNGDSTTVKGGANGDAINSYTLSTGSVPSKDDLSNVYAASHTRAVDGYPELYFGAERLPPSGGSGGDSHIDFEFLQSVVGRTAACGGTFTGHRTEGDLLLAVDFTVGGSLAGTTVWQWHCAALPAPQPPDGTVCDPGAGALYETITVPAAVSFTVNSADISCGGWVCRGNPTTVATNDFLEGGIDLHTLGFAGCFNTFLPHTRTSQPFTAILKDFTGPTPLHSCRTPALSSTSSPTGFNTVPGTTATDSVTVTNGGAGFAPTGTVTFFLCSPGQTTAGGCPAGGTQVGVAQTLSGGAVTSDPITVPSTLGQYCWRSDYTPDTASTGVYGATIHTNATSECFGVGGAPALPNTSMPFIAGVPIVPALPPPSLIALLALPLALIMRRTRGIAMLVLVATVLAFVPDMLPPQPAAASAAASQPLSVDTSVGPATVAPPIAVVAAATMQAHPGWRLVIPSIGVDALIQPVGLDGQGAMGSPASLDRVGWYDAGPVPGRPGDAVIDGHLGLRWAPAVFSNLAHLRPGDMFELIWPDGHQLHYRVSSSMRVPADTPAPSDLFARSGASRLSLITCAGLWMQDKATYSERLIVTAALA